MPAYQYTLGDARNSAIKKVAGVCADGDAFRDYVNEATERLIKRGGWFDTEQVARFCFEGCDVVFPRWVGTVLGVRLCYAGQVPIHNNWWSILGPQDQFGAANGYNWMSGLRDNGMVPIYNQVSGTEGKLIAYHVTKSQDVGKTCTIYGTAYGGQPLQESVDGVWRQGITITAIAPGADNLPAMTSVLVTKITSVVRQATQGMSYLYEYGEDADAVLALRDLAMYQPNETNPRYRRMTIGGLCGQPQCTDANGRQIRSLEAICKLEFIPVINDEDFLLISDFQALKLAVQALILEEAGNTADAELKFLSAIRELNYLDRSKSPSDQISVKVRTGSGMIRNPI